MLKVGTTGDIMIMIRNTGGGPVDTWSPPCGCRRITAAGGSGSNRWDCTGGRPGRHLHPRPARAAAATRRLQVRVDVGVAALPGGVVAGTVGRGRADPDPERHAAVLP